MITKLFKISTITFIFSMFSACIYSQNPESKSAANKEKGTVCSDECTAKNDTEQMSCKLTTPELRQRKETVIASLKKQVIEKKELKNGFAYKFPGTDNVLDELTEFIKTERECCDFFTFTIAVDKSEAWLELTGADGVKEFITAELDF